MSKKRKQLNPVDSTLAPTAGRTRPGGAAYATVAVLIAISAWFENRRVGQPDPQEISRTPASVDRIPASVTQTETPKVSIQGAKYSVQFKFEVRGSQLSFADIIEAFSGTDVTNELPEYIGNHAEGIAKSLRSEAEKRSEGGKIYYYSKGWSRYMPFMKKKSRLGCTESGGAKSGTWSQRCNLDMGYESASEFSVEYHQSAECTQSGAGIACTLRFAGTGKAVDMSNYGVLKKMLNLKSLSANQVAFTAAQSILRSAHSLVAVFEYNTPLKAHAEAAVEAFYRSSHTKLIAELDPGKEGADDRNFSN